ncbi:MAG: phage recombination protein Bet, partial [Patescibacteria group bacterium]
ATKIVSPPPKPDEYQIDYAKAGEKVHALSTEVKSLEDKDIITVADLTVLLLRKMFPKLKDVSDLELLFALQMCKAYNLNPIRKEIFLIPYKNKDGSITISLQPSQDIYAIRATTDPDYDGMKSGIIVKPKDGAFKDREEREGQIYDHTNEEIIGGWATGYRKSWKQPTTHRVAFSVYNKNSDFWARDPAFMIEKVARSQCWRRLYPDKFSKLYDEAEMPEQPTEVKS